MSTLRRAREHIAKAREILSNPRPTKQELASLKSSLTSWENHVRTEPDNTGFRLTATWLFGAGCLCGAISELKRSEEATGTPLWHEMHSQIADYIQLSINNAEFHSDQWEAHAIAEDDQPDPVTAHGRIAGLQRTATIRHACGCEGTLTLSGCSEATWREALRTNAAVDCTRCRVEKEQAALTPDERTRRAMALWE